MSSLIPPEQAADHVLHHVLAQFQDPATRTVTLANTFRWVAAAR